MAARKASGNTDDSRATYEFDEMGSSSGSEGAGGGSSDSLIGAVNQAQQKAGDAVEQVRDQAGQMTDQIREQAKTRLTTQKDTLADSLKSVALSIRQTGQHLREDDQATIAQYADQAAERIEQFQRYIGNTDLAEITADVERLARRQPVLFIGGSLALGILAARFLKSSGRQATSGSYSGGQYAYGGERAKVYGLLPGEVGATGGSYDTASVGSYDATLPTDYTSTGAASYADVDAPDAPESWRSGDATS